MQGEKKGTWLIEVRLEITCVRGKAKEGRGYMFYLIS